MGRSCRLVIATVACVFAFLVTSRSAWGQTTTATLSGVIVDEANAVVPKVVILLTNDATALKRELTTNAEGFFSFTLLPPGAYTLRAKREGFTPVEVPAISLNVNDQVALRIQLKVASLDETVTVTANPSRSNTSPAIGTVVDRQFADNLPLNGRSFQSLIALTPGVVLTKASVGESGQFSVNGQRANANYFTVDGVSANFNIPAGGGISQSAGGALPALSVWGGSNSIVSVDALEEFKVLTSTFAPEFGRMPGGQVSIVTRSGTNALHGSAFEYFRDESLDANDWFNNARGLAKPESRQHDFGGVTGGPLLRNRLFFFASYEGLRLKLPQTPLQVVPSLETRAAAPASLRPYLDAWPLPNGRVFSDGTAEFATTFANDATLNATSVRLDYHSGNAVMFGRINHAPSRQRQRAPGTSAASIVLASESIVDTATMGVTHRIVDRWVHDARLNFSWASGSSTLSHDTFGGASSLDPGLLFPPGRSADDSLFRFQMGAASGLSVGRNADHSQRQFNMVDTIATQWGGHGFKLGVDYRQLSPTSRLTGLTQTVSFSSIGPLGGAAPRGTLLSGFPSSYTINANEPFPLRFHNVSVFGQDTWQISSHVTLTYGARWEVNPPPEALDGKILYALALGDDPAATVLSSEGAQLAPVGTPWYRTTFNNVAPRAGLAVRVADTPGREVTVRGGAGVFFDIGSGFSIAPAFPYQRSRQLLPTPAVPVTDPQLLEPAPINLSPVGAGFSATDPSLRLPRTYQWNVTVEQGIGAGQSISASYVGARGRELLRNTRFTHPRPTTVPFAFVNVIFNGAWSAYDALQVQFQRRLSRGLQATAAYTWSTARDVASSDSTGLAPDLFTDIDADWGPSDFDVRHSFVGALTYQLPGREGGSLWNIVGRGWGIDVIARARSATPVDVNYFADLGFGSFSFRPDVVASTPFYTDDPLAPGGRRLTNTRTVVPGNPNPQIGAFIRPAQARQGTLGRNASRGFPVSQVDLALSRRVSVTHRATVEVRIEAFNVLNHPNFGDPVGSLTSPQFGESTQMLGRSLQGGGGGGGLSPLYQIGGPRSIQLSGKVRF